MATWEAAMPDGALVVTEVRLTAASQRDAESGLLAYLTVVLNGSLAVDGLALRRSVEGKTYVSYPARTDRRGGRHPIVRPLSEDARVELEREVFRALRAGGGR